MSENATLKIHTRMPEAQAEGAPPQPRRRRPWRRAGRRPAYGDRLLRNSAIACAALLGILALGNVRQPWAQRAAEGIERALSMRINLDESIGALTFVRQIMPESALVFLNVSATALAAPTDGEVVHAWSNLQPWLMYAAGDSPVYAAGDGTVTAVSPLSSGGWGLLVDHGGGLESMYANLSAVAVRAGDAVSRGQRLGERGDALYFELRQDGESVDPSERLGL